MSMESQLKNTMGQAGAGESESFRELHLPNTGVYKIGLNLLINHLISPSLGGELA